VHTFKGDLTLAYCCPTVSLTAHIVLICKSLWLKASTKLINVNTFKNRQCFSDSSQFLVTWRMYSITWASTLWKQSNWINLRKWSKEDKLKTIRPPVLHLCSSVILLRCDWPGVNMAFYKLNLFSLWDLCMPAWQSFTNPWISSSPWTFSSLS